MLQILHEAVKRNCTLSEDCMNAFHELDRDKIEACLEQKSPVLHLYFLAYYAEITELFYRLNSGQFYQIDLSFGGMMGDSLFSCIFDLVYMELVLKPIQEKYPDVFLCAIHDDTYLSGDPRDETE